MKRCVVFAMAILLAASVARASTISYALTIDHCTGSCNPNVGDVVTINDQGLTGNIIVSVSMAGGDHFWDGGFDGDFGFNLLGNPTISVTGLPADWSLIGTTAGSYGMDGFGNFDYALNCSDCKSTNVSSLSFHVLSPGLTLTSFADLSRNPPGDTNVYFAADLAGVNGKTGAVGGLNCSSGCGGQPPPPPVVPEPGSLVLFGSGLVALAARVRSYRK